MSFLRRTILAPVFLWLIVIGFFSFFLYLLLETLLTLPFNFLPILAALSLFLILSTALFVLKIHLPLNKIVNEMKALLTGKSYRRIMTDKRNEIGILAHFFNEITRNLESISKDVESHERIKKELNAAQKIQQDLLPKNIPNIPGLEVVAKTRPASEIGGDTFDFYQPEQRTLFYIGDSTGHGIPAGIVMVMVDVLLETFMDLKESLMEIMIHLNKYLKPHLQTTMFMTMMLLEWKPGTQTVTWVGAGHEYLLHLSTKTEKATLIPCGGIALGMIPDFSTHIKEQSLVLEENDFLILYSDGISEAKNIRGEIYGAEQLKSFVRNHARADMSSEELFEKIAIDVGRFMEGRTQEDDMTLIVMKHTKTVQEIQDKSTHWEEENPNAGNAAAPLAP